MSFTSLGSFAVDGLSGIGAKFTDLELLNPDINQDGQPDYTTIVFPQDAILLGQSLIGGTGVVDYFRDVLRWP